MFTFTWIVPCENRSGSTDSPLSHVWDGRSNQHSVRNQNNEKVQTRNPIETAQTHTSNFNPTDKMTSKVMEWIKMDRIKPNQHLSHCLSELHRVFPHSNPSTIAHAHGYGGSNHRNESTSIPENIGDESNWIESNRIESNWKQGDENANANSNSNASDVWNPVESNRIGCEKDAELSQRIFELGMNVWMNEYMYKWGHDTIWKWVGSTTESHKTKTVVDEYEYEMIMKITNTHTNLNESDFDLDLTVSRIKVH